MIMERRYAMQNDGVNARKRECNCCKESEFYDPSVRTSVQEFVEAFMHGETPVEVGFRGIVDDVPQPVCIYPDVCHCGNLSGKYSIEETK